MTGVIVPQKPKIAVCMPALDFFATFSAYDLGGLLAHTIKSADVTVGRLIASGTYIYEQRETLAQAVIDNGYTHAMWIDTDMRFPKDAILRLLSRALPIVGASYPSRHIPYLPVAARSFHTDERVYTTRQHEGVEEVAAMGFGLLLMTREALEAVEQPRFCPGWNQETKQYVHEDVSFCFKAKKAGVPIFLDHDLTKLVKHIGRQELDYESSLNARDALNHEEPLIVPAGA